MRCVFSCQNRNDRGQQVQPQMDRFSGLAAARRYRQHTTLKIKIKNRCINTRLEGCWRLKVFVARSRVQVVAGELHKLKCDMHKWHKIYRHAVRLKPPVKSTVSDVTDDDNTAFLSVWECVRGKRQLQGHVPFILFKTGAQVWQSEALLRQKARSRSVWACTRGLRCPCNRPPPRPTRSPVTTPGSMSPAPPAPAGSECPSSPWLQTETTGWRSAQEETAGGAVEC